jgi:hypothetical protein
MPFRIGRIIVAALVALAVAMLPATIGFAAGAPTAIGTSASQAMPDCDHHHHAPSDKTQKTADDGACMAACALNCFNFMTTAFSGIAYAVLSSAALLPVPASSNISSQMGNPPFRPPRA